MTVGLFLDISIHETAQVADSGPIYGQVFAARRVLDVARATKPIRNLLMVVVIPLVAYLQHRPTEPADAPSKQVRGLKLFPFFIPGLLLLAVVWSAREATLRSALALACLMRQDGPRCSRAPRRRSLTSLRWPCPAYGLAPAGASWLRSQAVPRQAGRRGRRGTPGPSLGPLGDPPSLSTNLFGSSWRVDRRPFHVVTAALKEPSLAGCHFPTLQLIFPPLWRKDALQAIPALQSHFLVIDDWGCRQGGGAGHRTLAALSQAARGQPVRASAALARISRSGAVLARTPPSRWARRAR